MGDDGNTAMALVLDGVSYRVLRKRRGKKGHYYALVRVVGETEKTISSLHAKDAAHLTQYLDLLSRAAADGLTIRRRFAEWQAKKKADKGRALGIVDSSGNPVEPS